MDNLKNARVKPLFKINWEDVIDTRGGKNRAKHQYVTTTPPHPHGEQRSDRKKKYVYLHRAVMELHLGRYLKPGEEVHHKDENGHNNNISNLELTDHDTHQIEHSKKRKFWKKSPRTKKRVKRASIDRVISLYRDQA